MTVPTTYEEVADWFCRDKRQKRSIVLMRQLLAGMQARPGLSAPMAPSVAWNLILDFNLMAEDSHYGWITRDGTFLGSAYAAHERLLSYLGIEAWQAEDAGWARCKPTSYACHYQLSKPQQRHLMDAGVLVDDADEYQKPKFVGKDDLLVSRRDA